MRVRALVLFLSVMATGCGMPASSPEPIAVSDAARDARNPSPAEAASNAATEQEPAAQKPAAAAKPATSEPVTLPLPTDPQIQLTAEEIQAGWIQLFDGQTLTGWFANNNVNWHVNDAGEIAASEGEPGLLLTSVPFADYELRCDYHVSKNANSGIFLRTLADPKKVDADCYELNICDSHPQFKTASFVGRAQPVKEVGGEEVWKTFHIRAEGRRITVKLDDELVLDHTDETPGVRLTGHIGLQKNAGQVRFRNVFLKPLSTKPLFNGTDLTGWHPVPGSKAQFELADGAIQVSGGSGFLETDESWSDFVLQFEARTEAETNSGVFFRLIPGTEAAPSNGYELQVNNTLINGDRRQPKDAGTGAIFRRTRARWVPASDGEWLTATLIASGPRFSAWVNGLQVTDWEDTRAPHANPRQGRKVEAGPLSLQGHDPGTRAAFRNLRIVALPGS